MTLRDRDRPHRRCRPLASPRTPRGMQACTRLQAASTSGRTRIDPRAQPRSRSRFARPPARRRHPARASPDLRSARSSEVPNSASMPCPRVFVVSDIHTDFEENMEWVRGLSDTKYTNDAIILAGDISDDLSTLEETFTHFASRFRYTTSGALRDGHAPPRSPRCARHAISPRVRDVSRP